MTRKTLSILLATATLVIFGCSSGPSVSRAEQSLRERIEKESEGKIKLISFSKTNGQEAAPLGVPTYKLDYEALIEFTEDCRWGTIGPGGWQGDYTVYSPNKESTVIEIGSPPFRSATKGSQTKVTGSLEFQKTEKGWEGADGKIY